MSDLWHIENATQVPCAGAHSGNGAFYFGIDSQCNYDNGQINDGCLTSPQVSISGIGDTNFSFWTKWQVESVDPECYAQMWIEYQVISPTAQAQGWTFLTQIGPASDPPTSSPYIGMASVTGYDGTPEWEFVQLSLAPFAGETIQLRFHFLESACLAPDCNNKICGPPDADYENFLGWVVDDIYLGCPPPGLNLTKAASPAFAATGSTVSYVIDAEAQTASANSVSVWDTLPQGAQYLSATASPSLQSGQFFEWNLPNLSAGQTDALTVWMTVGASVPVPSEWLNQASASSSLSSSFAQSNVVDTAIRMPGLNLTKSASPNLLNSGSTLLYTITLSNDTSPMIPAINLQELLPQGFVEENVYPSFANETSWTVLDLNPGETRVYTVSGFVNGFAGQSLTNVVEAYEGTQLMASASAQVSLLQPNVPRLSIRSVYPNPAPSHKPGLPQLAFVVFQANQAMNLNLDVFTVSGVKARSISFSAPAGEGQVSWDLSNSAGRPVASGVYLLHLYENDAPTGLSVEAWARLAVLQ